MAKDYEGRDATLAYFGQIGQESGGTFQAELQQLFAGDDGRVIGLQRSTGERDGKRLDVSNCIVFELRDGKVVDGTAFYDSLSFNDLWTRVQPRS